MKAMATTRDDEPENFEEEERELAADIIARVTRRDRESGADLLEGFIKRRPLRAERRTPAPEPEERKSTWSGQKSPEPQVEAEEEPAVSPESLAKFEESELAVEARRARRASQQRS